MSKKQQIINFQIRVITVELEMELNFKNTAEHPSQPGDRDAPLLLPLKSQPVLTPKASDTAARLCGNASGLG